MELPFCPSSSVSRGEELQNNNNYIIMATKFLNVLETPCCRDYYVPGTLEHILTGMTGL